MKNLTDSQYHKLREYAEYDGTEYGELINSMLDVHRHMDYIQDVTLEEQINRVLLRILKDFEDNYKFVERDVTYTKKYIDLVPSDEA